MAEDVGEVGGAAAEEDDFAEDGFVGDGDFLACLFGYLSHGVEEFGEGESGEGGEAVFDVAVACVVAQAHGVPSYGVVGEGVGDEPDDVAAGVGGGVGGGAEGEDGYAGGRCAEDAEDV